MQDDAAFVDSTRDLDLLVSAHLADPGVAWSLGSFGAIAEFMWALDESCVRGLDAPLSRVTPRGGIAVAPPPDAVPVAYTTPSRHEARRRDDIAFCLPPSRCAMGGRSVVTESGPDTQALRAAAGRSIFEPDSTLTRALPRLSPHRVFVGPCGRIEVYQPIPPAEGRSPDGPHTHVLPKLLRAGRTHAANLPIPAGLVPCLTIHLSRPDPDHARMDLQGD